MPETQLMSVFRAALSSERLDAFRDSDESANTDEEILARYAWNVALSVAFGPSLHFAELLLRNTILEAGERLMPVVTRHGGVPSWLDCDPPVLSRNHAATVSMCRNELSRRQTPLTRGRLVAELNLGFWVHLFDRSYDQSSGRHGGFPLWTAINLRTAFPHAPAHLRTRDGIRSRFEEIRVFRNRISHHEKIIRPQRSLVENRAELEAKHRRIIGAIEWMNLEVAKTLRKFDPLPTVLRAGLQPYVTKCQQVFGLGVQSAKSE